MKPATGGYTLLEVMLFLAISTVFLAISNVILQNQSAHTEFTASMNDVSSKMQKWIDEVKNGFTASQASASALAGNYNCSIDALTNSPKLEFPGGATPGRATGSNQECVFLGRAIMVNDAKANDPKDINDKIYAFTVLGRRTYNDAGDQVPVNNIKNASPVAAVFPVGDASPNINLTEVYKIPNGVRLRHAYTSAVPGPTSDTLAGFLTDPGNATNSILAVQYPLHNNIDPTAWATNAWDIPGCIHLTFVPCSTPPDNLWPMNNWNLCFESMRNDERALLTVTSTNGVGALIKLKLDRGDDICD